MKLTRPGKDVIKITEEDYFDNQVLNTDNKVHLIKFNFKRPTKEKVEWVLKSYPFTNRFIIEDNIKFYNDILKTTNKKYYIENIPNVDLISFIRKNNKILLNFLNLLDEEKEFMLNYLLFDILKNVEIIMLDEENIRKYQEKFKKWSGNIIIQDPNYEL